ncbi:hypothetical protein Holit_02173 [Hollandina sp. SP2]
MRGTLKVGYGVYFLAALHRKDRMVLPLNRSILEDFWPTLLLAGFCLSVSRLHN